VRPHWSGGKLTEADEARVAALLAEGDEAEGPGRGYRPAEEMAGRLAELDALLLAFGGGAADGPDGGLPSTGGGAEAATPVAGRDYLREMRAERAEARVLDDVREGLARLHSVPPTAAASEREEEQVRRLLLQTRAEAEEMAEQTSAADAWAREAGGRDARVPFSPRED